MPIQIFQRCQDIRSHVASLKAAGKTIGVVPTMGALHSGHLSLVEASQAKTDETIVTIFVNPTQFAQGEDLDQYPRPFEQDIDQLESLGVPTVFAATGIP